MNPYLGWPQAALDHWLRALVYNAVFLDVTDWTALEQRKAWLIEAGATVSRETGAENQCRRCTSSINRQNRDDGLCNVCRDGKHAQGSIRTLVWGCAG